MTGQIISDDELQVSVADDDNTTVQDGASSGPNLPDVA